jgi:hypothetical protein
MRKPEHRELAVGASQRGSIMNSPLSRKREQSVVLAVFRVKDE